MTAYYQPEHLSRFGSIGEGNRTDKFSDWYGAVFPKAPSSGEMLSPWPSPTPSNAPTASTPTPPPRSKKAPTSSR
jgi:hypothetical protein